MSIQKINVVIEATIDLELNPEIDNPNDSFDLLFEQLLGDVTIENKSFFFPARITRLGLPEGRKVVVS